MRRHMVMTTLAVNLDKRKVLTIIGITVTVIGMITLLVRVIQTPI